MFGSLGVVGMEFIINCLGMLGMIIVAAQQAQIPPELILAIIEVESNGQPYAARINPTYAYTMPQARRPAICNMDTELYMQRTSWGLMQIMGATARSVGFDGWLPELAEPHVNIQVGVAIIGNLMTRHQKKYGVAGVIAAYNAGSPRVRGDGKFINQGYVDKVMKAMEKYKAVVDEKKEGALAEMEKTTIEASEAVTALPEEMEVETVPDESEINLDKMNKTQLLELAKLNGITVDSKAKVDEIRDAIAAAGKAE